MSGHGAAAPSIKDRADVKPGLTIAGRAANRRCAGQSAGSASASSAPRMRTASPKVDPRAAGTSRGTSSSPATETPPRKTRRASATPVSKRDLMRGLRGFRGADREADTVTAEKTLRFGEAGGRAAVHGLLDQAMQRFRGREGVHANVSSRVRCERTGDDARAGSFPTVRRRRSDRCRARGA